MMNFLKRKKWEVRPVPNPRTFTEAANLLPAPPGDPEPLDPVQGTYSEPPKVEEPPKRMLPSAAQALEQSKIGYSKLTDTIMPNLIDSIAHCAKRGNTHYEFYANGYHHELWDWLSYEESKKLLADLGYRLEAKSRNDNYSYCISWGPRINKPKRGKKASNV